MKCYYCSDIALDNRSLCERHAKKKREEIKRKRVKRKINGLCTMCGVKNNNDKTQCDSCNEKQSKNHIKRAINRKANNCCTLCGRSKSYVDIWTNTRCPGCHFKEKFGWIGTKEEAELIINNLLQKQNYRCAVSGRDLKTNKYHIDHIIPRSEKPELLASPDNWQIIVEDANFFRKDKTIEQLILISKDITKEALRRGILSLDDILGK